MKTELLSVHQKLMNKLISTCLSLRTLGAGSLNIYNKIEEDKFCETKWQNSPSLQKWTIRIKQIPHVQQGILHFYYFFRCNFIFSSDCRFDLFVAFFFFFFLLSTKWHKSRLFFVPKVLAIRMGCWFCHLTLPSSSPWVYNLLVCLGFTEWIRIVVGHI